MDTVTEAPLAIALAREGGIGVIHKNMSIADQAAHVRRVKRAESGMIYDPITISKDHTVGDALALMHENKIGGIPVVDADNKLIGIVTNRDLRFQPDSERPIEQVMTRERIVTTHNTELKNAAEVLLQNKIEKLPVVDDEGHLIGLITYRDITKLQDNPNACKDAKGRLRVAAGIGITPDAMDRVAALVAGVLYYVKGLDPADMMSVNFRLVRIRAWLFPYEYEQDKAYQSLQGLYAIGSGGLWGKGLGNSIQKLGKIPEPYNDYIFAIICEELGIFGAGLIILLFIYLLYRIYSISQTAEDLFGRMLSIGVMSHIALQVILNLMVVTNLFPTTGVTLPFFSYGGSSLWGFTFLLFILLRIDASRRERSF